MAYLIVILPQISLVISSDQEIRFSERCYIFIHSFQRNSHVKPDAGLPLLKKTMKVNEAHVRKILNCLYQLSFSVLLISLLR